jgi:hypothetical protein
MSLPNYMGCLMQFYKSLLLYYTEMCFEILNFFQRKSVFFHEKSTLLRIRNCWTEMLARSLGHIILLVHFRSKR